MAVTDDDNTGSVSPPLAYSISTLPYCHYPFSEQTHQLAPAAGPKLWSLEPQHTNQTSYYLGSVEHIPHSSSSALQTDDAIGVDRSALLYSAGICAFPLSTTTSSENNNAVAVYHSNSSAVIASDDLAPGSDVFMSSAIAIDVLNMGFDRTDVKNVIHLKVVETGETYSSVNELVEAVLAYTVVMKDHADFDSVRSSPQHQQSGQKQTQHMNPERSSEPPGRMDPPPRNHSERKSTVKTSAANKNASSNVQGLDDIDGIVAALDALSASPVPKVNGKKKSKRKNKKPANPNRAAAGAAAGATGVAADSAVAAVAGQFRTTLSKDKCVKANSKPSTQQLLTTEDDAVLPWVIEQENKRLRSCRMCKICQEEEGKVIFLPCGHMLCCDGCVSFVSKCSVCQGAVESSVRVFFS